MVTRKTLSRALVTTMAMLAGAVFIVAASAPSATASSARSAAASKLVIGSVVYSEDTVPFLAKLGLAESQEAAKLGVTIRVVNGGSDATTQVSEMQQFIAEKVNLILLTNSNPTALVPAVKEANAAGIPVISVNTPITAGRGARSSRMLATTTTLTASTRAP